MVPSDSLYCLVYENDDLPLRGYVPEKHGKHEQQHARDGCITGEDD